MQADQSCLIKPTACAEKVNKVNDDVILTFNYVKLELRDETEQEFLLKQVQCFKLQHMHSYNSQILFSTRLKSTGNPSERRSSLLNP